MTKYTKEEWFVPLNNRIYGTEVSDTVVLAENERGDQLALNQETISTELFNPFKKQYKEVTQEVIDYLENKFLNRPVESLDNEIKRLKDIKLIKESNSPWKKEEIKELQDTVSFNIPSDLITLVANHSLIVKPFEVLGKTEVLQNDYIDREIIWAKDNNRSLYQRASKKIADLGEHYPVIKAKTNLDACVLILTKNGYVKFVLDRDNEIADVVDHAIINGTKKKYDIATFISEVYREKEYNHYLELFKIGKYKIPGILTKNISQEFFFKKKDNTKLREVPKEVKDYIFDHYDLDVMSYTNNLDKEYQRLIEVGYVEEGKKIWTDKDINHLKEQCPYSIPNEVIDFLKKYSHYVFPGDMDVATPKSIYQELPFDSWKDHDANATEKLKKQLDEIGPVYQLISNIDNDHSTLLITKKGLVDLYIEDGRPGKYELYYDYTDRSKKKHKMTIATYVFDYVSFTLADHVESMYRKGLWNPPGIATESIDDYMDTPLMSTKSKDEDGGKMTADDLTNDKEEAEEVKEEFKDSGDSDSDTDDTDSDSDDNSEENTDETDESESSDDSKTEESDESDDSKDEESDSDEDNDEPDSDNEDEEDIDDSNDDEESESMESLTEYLKKYFNRE